MVPSAPRFHLVLLSTECMAYTRPVLAGWPAMQEILVSAARARAAELGPLFGAPAVFCQDGGCCAHGCERADEMISISVYYTYTGHIFQSNSV